MTKVQLMIPVTSLCHKKHQALSVFHRNIIYVLSSFALRVSTRDLIVPYLYSGSKLLQILTSCFWYIFCFLFSLSGIKFSTKNVNIC